MKRILPYIIYGLLIGFLLTTIYSPSYTGNVVKVIDTQYLLNNPEEVKDDYNTNSENAPSFIKTIFGNEVIKLNISLNNSTKRILYIKTERGLISYINQTKTDEPTLNVWSDENTINSISASEDQLKAFDEALKSRKIDYKALNFKTKMKAGTAVFAFKIWSWFN